MLTPHQAKYIAHALTLQYAGGGVDRLSQALFNASVDLNPHQIWREAQRKGMTQQVQAAHLFTLQWQVR